ncbi:PD-(D/E)XK nuclease family protein, partial [Hallella colorans]
AYVDSKHTTYYLQAFLYACIVRHGNESQKIINKGRHPVAPALFFIRQASSSNYDPTLKFNVGNKKYEVIDDIDAKYEEFMERLKLLLGEIFNTDIPFTPTEDGNRCACCPYRDICGL